MDIVDLIVEKRDGILATCTKFGAKDVRIFGSCARNDYDEKSDVDVLVQLPAELNGIKYFARLADIEEELKQVLNVDVDVVDESSLKGKARERVLREAVSL